MIAFSGLFYLFILGDVTFQLKYIVKVVSMKRPQSVKQAGNQWFLLHADHMQPQKHPNSYSNIPSSKLVSKTSNLNRLLPKHIHYDKQKLYYQTLQLKTALNDISDENHKLKTRVAILQKEKERITKTDQDGSRLRSGTVGQNAEKDNITIVNLKKMLRQSKQEAEAAKINLANLKKTIRYTKINELDIEKQLLIQENKKLAKTIGQLQLQLERNSEYQSDINNMEKELRTKAEQLRECQDTLVKYEELMEDLQMNNRELSQKLVVWEKKYQRDLAVNKRKAEQLARSNDVLKTEKKAIEQRLERQRKQLENAKKLTRPTSSHPYTHASQPSPGIDKSKQKQEAIEVNNRLRKQLQDAKCKLAVSESRLKQQLADNPFSKSKQPFELILTSKEDDCLQDNRKGKIIQQEGKEEMKERSSQVIQDIRGILTYRMKYNRYTFDELKSDIQASPLEAFTREDVLTMLTEEPFCLTRNYGQQLLNDCYKKNKLIHSQQVTASQLLEALRGVIEEFNLLPEQEEEHVLYEIADSITRHRSTLQGRFLDLKRASGQVTSQQMQSILLECTQLSKEAIDLAICYVVVNAENLRKVSYQQLLHKFLISNESESSARGSKALKGKDYSQHSMEQSQEIGVD